MESTYSKLVKSVIGFVDLLRRAGIKTGSDGAIKATQAISCVPLKRHEDLYWSLKTSLVCDHHDEEVFNQLFALYWGHAKLPDSALSVSLPRSKIKSKSEKSFSKRTLDAFNKAHQRPLNQKTEVEILRLSWSDQQRLQKMDFEAMSSEEYLLAQKLLLKMKLTFKPMQSRRFKNTTAVKKIDFRTTLKQSSKYNFEIIDLKFKKPKTYYPPLIIFIDISGSMSRYSQIMLQFSHLLNTVRGQVYVYLFATRLTAITHELNNRDIEESLQRIGNKVSDWNSGTRIGDCIKHFNNKHLKRVINSNSQILLVTDGLDRGDQELFEKHISRLRRSCKTLLWLNPLLRYEEYQPKTKGAITLLPHVDKMIPIHNLSSLEQLINFLHLNINNIANKAA